MVKLRQNRLFKSDEEQFHQEINVDLLKDHTAVLNVAESKKFWSNIWSVQKSHKQNVEWLNGIKNEIKNENRQERMAITEEVARNKVRRGIGIGKHLAEMVSKYFESRNLSSYMDNILMLISSCHRGLYMAEQYYA